MLKEGSVYICEQRGQGGKSWQVGVKSLLINGVGKSLSSSRGPSLLHRLIQYL